MGCRRREDLGVDVIGIDARSILGRFDVAIFDSGRALRWSASEAGGVRAAGGRGDGRRREGVRVGERPGGLQREVQERLAS